MNKSLLFDRSYINGQWTKEGTASFEVMNPANGETLATVADGDVIMTKKRLKQRTEPLNPGVKQPRNIALLF